MSIIRAFVCVAIVHKSYPVICSQIVNLFVPEYNPDVFTDELDNVKRVREQPSITTESARNHLESS